MCVLFWIFRMLFCRLTILTTPTPPRPLFSPSISPCFLSPISTSTYTLLYISNIYVCISHLPPSFSLYPCINFCIYLLSLYPLPLCVYIFLLYLVCVHLLHSLPSFYLWCFLLVGKCYICVCVYMHGNCLCVSMMKLCDLCVKSFFVL